MRAAVVFLAIAMLGCRARQAAGPSPAELGMVYTYPATHAGCYALAIIADSSGRPAPAYPSLIGLDTAYLVVGVPEPVAFRRLTMAAAWRERLPGLHYWRGQDSSVVIEYEGSGDSVRISIAVDMRERYRRGQVHWYRQVPRDSARWDLRAVERPCRGLELQ